MVELDQVRPLAPANERAVIPSYVEDRGSGRASCYRRHRRCVLCGGCCASTLLILGIVILVLGLTVFKIKDPELTVNSITVTGLSVGTVTFNRPVSVNATLTTQVSVKNPNHASFKFGKSTSSFYYQGDNIGVAYAPSGKASAERTLRMNVTVDVLIDEAASNSQLSQDVLKGSVDLTSYTEMGGRVSVLGIVKKHVDIGLNCSMTMDLSLTQQQTINVKDCHAHVN
ncbi:hypothetical protein QJS04_geneDACA011854 [Acorus gramineus]|uniref:Late embryogenesis abundant protein LEA-2 subgroup domain-containing protein n=1 Tax=Acorus gramineus TaxID=55184 RepID=A0AAV9BG37_ACOGR|nr:hypothetical protein QJS04_geneDACA011854 [Acorus gramineus]